MAAVMRMNWAVLKRKRVWVGLAIASALAALISHVPLGSWLDWISMAHSWLAGQGEWAIPTFMALYIMAAILGLPNIVLILAAGTLFGLTQGVVSASVADTLSIAACFVIGQTVGGGLPIPLEKTAAFISSIKPLPKRAGKLFFLPGSRPFCLLIFLTTGLA
jgi:hypothetical protein